MKGVAQCDFLVNIQDSAGNMRRNGFLSLFFYFYTQLLYNIMGKGDQRSKRGKVHIGTYGRLRKRKKMAKKAAAAKKAGTKKKATKKAAK